MWNTQKSLCLIFLIWVCTSVKAAELDVTPTSFLPGVSRAVHLACHPSDTTDIAQLLLLQILKVQASNRVPLVTYVVGNPLKIEDTPLELRISAQETYDPTDLHSSSLRVTISDPEDSAVGSYLCVAESIDSHGSLHRFMHSAALTSLDREGVVPIFYKTVLRELKNDIDSLTRDLTSVTDKSTDIGAQNGKAQAWLSSTDTYAVAVTDTATAVDRIFQAARNRGEELGKELVRLRSITPEIKVSFYAHLAPQTLNVPPNAVVVFNTLVQHTDNSYNVTTGIFTAPVNGTYFLRTGLMVAQGVPLYASIMVGDLAVASLYAYDDFNIKHSTATAVVRLSAGQQVKVVQRSSGNVALQGFYGNATLSTHFMGALLW